MSNCSICGNELLTGDIHWAIGLCNTCYNKHYKSDEKKYVDMLHKETGELLVNSFAKKDKQITELQKQLEEKEKTIQGLVEAQKYLEQSVSYQMFLDVQKQLKAQPKEIIEKVKGAAIIDDEEYSNDPILYKITEEELDDILKEYGE